MAELEITAAFVVALVFAAAAVGKAIGAARSTDYGIALFEAVLAAAVVLRPSSAGVSGVAVTVAACYVAYAIARPAAEPCACFGRRLPVTSKTGQVTRNVFLLAVASGQLALVTLVGTSHPTMPMIDGACAVVGATALVAGPWLTAWLRSPAYVTR